MLHDIYKIVRSYDPHLHAIRKGVKLRTIEETGWIESFLQFFLESTNPYAYAMANSPEDSHLRQESRVYLNRLLQLVWMNGRRLTASTRGVLTMNNAPVIF
jgi:hypothetical protein